ncbi:hypothetical protein HYDPIDRAFT_26714 [Hydnomerulius pinastri MD-312]|nr:hypothetical protein HYDPIDRAFT_26714 [Hydnomerulius pinastri MD-312]
MAHTPPRSDSPVPRHVTVPRPGHALQISPNLEALLQHDELTRRNSGSPTSLYHPISQIPSSALSSGFAISLPPPPPRNVQVSKKAGHHQEAATTRAKEVQRKKSANMRSDSWPDSLPIFANDGVMKMGHPSPASSRSMTPNPFINPTPVVQANNTPEDSEVDEPLTPKQLERSPLSEQNLEPTRVAEGRSRPSVSDAAHRSSPALHKVEKMLCKGRDSLNLFTSTAGGLKLKLDGQETERRSNRSDCVDLSVNHAAVSDSQMRQVPAPAQRLSNQLSAFGDVDTATVLSSRSTARYLNTPLLAPNLAPSEASSTRSLSIYSESSYPFDDGSSIRRYPTASLPHLPLPSMASSQPPRLQPVARVTGHDQSFIDFFSPSSSDDTIFHDIQSSPDELALSKLHLRPPSLSIPSSNLYSSVSHNLSSASLASMTFAPPSPSSVSGDYPSPVYPHSDSSSSSIALSTMMFAPPSPTAELISPTYPRSVSPASSTHSLATLEFAPPSPGPELLDKPTLPTAPKPSFERGRKRRTDKRSISASPHPHPVAYHSLSPLPPTTNQLDANERADLIRRNRKLTQVFGRTPGAEGIPADSDEPRLFKRLPPPALAALLGTAKQKNHRHAMSVSVAVKTPGLKTEPPTPWQVVDNLWSPGGRRHSIPLTPTSFTFYLDDAPSGASANDHRGLHSLRDSQPPRATSPTSFIDLSDEEVTRDDASSAISFIDVPKSNKRLPFHHSSSTPSLVESLGPEEQTEAERRRKRDKLAKVHRFLGSRVPPEAVIGCVGGPSLPPTAMPEESMRENWLRGRRGSAAPLEHFDRGKEELDEREKALNVRRAQKMERVFGTPPPQTLFHTRQGRSTLPHSQPASPTLPSPTIPFVLSIDGPSNTRNLNQSAYKGKKTHRPGTSDSSRHLLPFKFGQSPTGSSFSESFSGYNDILATSSVYLNYQHSLNSLVDIIDRDDRESLVELHRFLHNELNDSPIEEVQTPVDNRRMSATSSMKSERRHSLPIKSSSTSLSSEFATSPKPETSEFQLRRRRAAKLTHFFGVDYRELIQDVLESIEKGVEEECNRGTLQPEEVEVLLHRVRTLRTKQVQLS